jgi:DNA-binding XRE family transcriptional regulator
MKSYKALKTKLLKDKIIKKSYDELGPEFVLVEKLIQKRLKQGLTQAELAKRIGTKQTAISRLERGTYNPTIKFLTKVAEGLDAKVKISVS